MPRKPKEIDMPTEVHILGRKVRLLTDSSILNSTRAGMWSFWNGSVVLDSDLSKDSMKATAVHEVVHDLDFAAATHMEERDVAAFSSVLFAFLRDNPEFVAWIMHHQ